MFVCLLAGLFGCLVVCSSEGAYRRKKRRTFISSTLGLIALNSKPFGLIAWFFFFFPFFFLVVPESHRSILPGRDE